MSLLENQNFTKKLKFIKNDDDEKLISFNISISCNHDIDKNILFEIESTINKLILTDYKNFDEYKKDLLFEKELERQKKELIKQQKENQKLQNKILMEQEKQQKLKEKMDEKYNKEYEKEMKKEEKKTNKPKGIRILGSI